LRLRRKEEDWVEGMSFQLPVLGVLDSKPISS